MLVLFYCYTGTINKYYNNQKINSHTSGAKNVGDPQRIMFRSTYMDDQIRICISIDAQKYKGYKKNALVSLIWEKWKILADLP